MKLAVIVVSCLVFELKTFQSRIFKRKLLLESWYKPFASKITEIICS